jgi:hypothetical protein
MKYPEVSDGIVTLPVCLVFLDTRVILPLFSSRPGFGPQCGVSHMAVWIRRSGGGGVLRW